MALARRPNTHRHTAAHNGIYYAREDYEGLSGSSRGFLRALESIPSELLAAQRASDPHGGDLLSPLSRRETSRCHDNELLAIALHCFPSMPYDNRKKKKKKFNSPCTIGAGVGQVRPAGHHRARNALGTYGPRRATVGPRAVLGPPLY